MMSYKKKWMSMLLALVCIIVLAGCSKTSDKSEGAMESKALTTKKTVTATSGKAKKAKPTNKPSASPKATVSSEPTASPEEMKDLSQYSTKNIPYGVGRDADPKTNRPTGLSWYQDQFNNLDVDFILPESNKIYLTFDEGYENGYTAKILDILKEKNVKAIFFPTLPYMKSQPELIKRMIAEGHLIGNHTVHHPSKGMATLSIDEQKAEITVVDDYMKKNYNYKMNLFRFPTGQFSEQSLAVVKSLGYRSVFWSFAYQDWIVNNQPSTTEALNTMMKRLHGGSIYLLHAVSKTNATVLGEFIDQARAKGFEFAIYPDPNKK
ncbi:polysaccharide deacetylase [Lachnospiraceae bacterium KM106-2]|nr:polysaccharide deacetylase [Lachnospiraceae bacterium KM106-2]